MSAQTIADVFVPVMREYKSQVMAATWGHLAPSRNRTYRGSITFAVGIYGSDNLNPTVLACDMRDLSDSPWWFDAMQGFLRDLAQPEGGVYVWTGTFRNYTFKGQVVTKLAGASDDPSR